MYKTSEKMPAILCYHGPDLVDYHSGLVVGVGKAYEVRNLISDFLVRKGTAYVAQHVRRCGGRATDGRTTRNAGYIKKLMEWINMTTMAFPVSC
jgi:hypothetical protein